MLMRQKDKPQGQCLQENKGEMAGGGVRDVRFLENLAWLFFL